jgi:tetratricopeptide (TPR) repeat protein
MTPEDAHELLLKIAPRIETEAERLAELCGRLPLALRAAASYLANFPDQRPPQYAERLRDERTRLEALEAEGVEISIKASLGLSYAALASDEAAVFRKLAVFPASFERAAAEYVLEDADNVLLSRLVNLSLVMYDGARYRLHDLVRLFASKKLDGPLENAEERSRVLLRHAQHYVKVLSSAEGLYLKRGDAIKQGLELFDLERGNILAGHAWAAANYKLGDEVAATCSRFGSAGALLSLRQHPGERKEWLEQALDAARKLGDRDAEARHLGNLGITYYSIGQYNRAIDYQKQSLTIAREIGDRLGEGQALGGLGLAYYSLGGYRRAIDFHQQLLAIAREIGDRHGEGRSLGNLGTAHDSLGEYRRAIDYHEKRLAIAREIGDRLGEGRIARQLGPCLPLSWRIPPGDWLPREASCHCPRDK